MEQFHSKLVGFGSDGAAVMVGRNAGVATLLKLKNEEIQSVHCYAHRLELAYKQSIAKVTLYQKVETLLSSLYTLYHKSAPMRSELEAVYKSEGIPCQVPTRIGGTRWLPFVNKALGICFKNYGVFTTHLTKVHVPEFNLISLVVFSQDLVTLF